MMTVLKKSLCGKARQSSTSVPSPQRLGEKCEWNSYGGAFSHLTTS